MLKVKKWMLLRAREAFQLDQKRLLGRLLARKRTLQRAYLLKEQLREIFHYPWIYLGALRRNLLGWCQMAIRSPLKLLKKLGYRLRGQREKVLASFEHGIPMGTIKAVNGKIALLRRQARDYRDPEYFKPKIYQRCSTKEDPWGEVILCNSSPCPVGPAQ